MYLEHTCGAKEERSADTVGFEQRRLRVASFENVVLGVHGAVAQSVRAADS